MVEIGATWYKRVSRNLRSTSYSQAKPKPPWYWMHTLANVCIQYHGGFGFACEYDVERKFRETRLYQVAPISTNLIYSFIAEHVLGLPRSF